MNSNLNSLKLARMTTHMAGAINVVHYDEVIPAGYFGSISTSATTKDDRLPNEEKEDLGLRKGPWTLEEDSVLINYVNTHGEGRWNSLARHAGLKRNGKSCRLRWLNYLRPCVRRGNITLQEQLLILQLHSRWGNRWSKIAEYLPGRTDNEVKNYWRTRVQKQAKHLKCDVNSQKFQDAMRCVWIPRLKERIHSSSQSLPPGQPGTNQTTHGVIMTAPETQYRVDPHFVPKTSCATSSDESSDQLHDHQVPSIAGPTTSTGRYGDGSGYDQMSGLQSDIEAYGESNNIWSSSGGDSSSVENWWNEENIWFLQQQLSDDS